MPTYQPPPFAYQEGYRAGIAAFNNGGSAVYANPSNDFQRGYNDGVREGGTSQRPSPGFEFTYNPFGGINQ